MRVGSRLLICTLFFVLAAAIVATAVNPVEAVAYSPPDIQGTVSSGGTPVEGVWVDLYVENTEWGYWEWADSTTTDASGIYGFWVYSTGNYAVGFWSDTGQYDPEYYDGATWVDWATVLSFSGTPITGIDADLSENALISGLVTDGSAVGLEGIYVEAWRYYDSGSGYDWWWSNGAFTEPDGAYDLWVEPGAHKVRFSGTLHASEYYDDVATLEDADVVSPEVGFPASSVDAVLVEMGTITGHVTDGDGVLDSSVMVYAAGQESYYDWESDSMITFWAWRTSSWTEPSGDYELTGLAAGDYLVGVDRGTTYSSEIYDGVHDESSATLVGVADETETSGIDFLLDPVGSVSGRVTSDGSTPLEMVQVTLHQFGSSSSGYGWNYVDSLSTDESGDYVFEAVSIGDYRVEFRDWSGSYLSEFYDDAEDIESADDVSVTAGSDISGVDAILATGGKIFGTITDADSGSTLAWVPVTVFKEASPGEWTVVASAETTDTGSYLVTGLRDGNYRVAADNHGYVMQFYDGASDVYTAADVAVVAGATTSGIDFALEKKGSVTGTVRDGEANPLEEIMVSAWTYGDFGSGYEWTRVGAGFTGPDGSYEVLDLESGDYVIEFYDDTGIYLPQYYDGALDIDAASPITVINGSATPGIDATMAMAGRITGTVTDPLDDPIPWVTVTVHDSSGREIAWGSTIEDGSYAVGGLTTGSYIVRFTDWSESYSGEFYSGKTTFESADEVAVTEGLVTAGIDAQLGYRGTISGTVSDGASGIQGVSVYFYDEGWGWGGTTTTGPDGEYTSPPLDAGEYVVEFWDSGERYISEYYDDAKSYESATSVAVSSGADTSGIDAELVLGGRIEGTITGEGYGQLGDSSEAELYSLDDGEWRYRENSWADSVGDYAFGALEAGTYKVEFNDYSGEFLDEFYNDKPDIESADEITVALGETVAGIDGELGRAGNIVGVVSDEFGPITDVMVHAYASDGVGGYTLVDAGWADYDGSYNIGGLGTGEYFVYFFPDDGSHPTLAAEFFSDAYTLDTATAVMVTAGNTTSGINAVLGAAGTVAGMVLDSYGDPVVGSRVYIAPSFAAWGSFWDVARRATVQPDGSYEFDGIGPGEWVVRFVGTDFLVGQYYSGKPSMELADLVTVPSLGADVTGIDATLTDAVEFKGWVEDEEATGLTGIKVGLWYDAGDAGWHEVASGYTYGGDFEKDYQLPGDYKIRLYDTQDRYAPAVFLPGVAELDDAEVFAAEEGDLIEFSYTMFTDTNPPETTSDISEDWQNGPVEVSLYPSDIGDSGVARTLYRVGAEPTDHPDSIYEGPFEVSAEGTTTVYFFSVDHFGNAESMQSGTLQIDNTGPTLSDDADPFYDVSAEINLYATDDLSGVDAIYYDLDEAGYVEGDFAEHSSEGTHTLSYYATDNVGNDSSEANLTFVVDYTPPTTTWDSAPSGYVAGPVTLDLKATDALSGIGWTYVRLNDAAPFVPVGEIGSLTAEGAYKISAYSIDGAGNDENAVVLAEFTIDKTGPATSITGVPTSWVNTNVSVGVSATDGLSGVASKYYSINGAAWSPYATAVPITAEGVTEFRAYATDAVGNSGSIKTASVKIDKTAPTLSDDAVDEYYGSAKIVLGATDARSGVEAVRYRVDGGGWTVGNTVQVNSVGDHIVEYKATDKAGNESAVTTLEFEVLEFVYEAVPVAGVNRYGTAVEASVKSYPDGAKTVVIATGANWPDALGGAALAGAVEGPLLLTPVAALPDAVMAEVERLEATDAYILGGTAAVSQAVEDALNDALSGTVTRLSGANRYGTANKVADEVIRLAGDEFDGDAFVATGANFPDALGASPLAASLGKPILLAPKSGDPYVPAEVESIAILGGEGAVSAGVEATLVELLGEEDVDRIGGADRYATAVGVAEHGVSLGMKWDGVGLATGAAFPDALSGGAMLGSMDSVVLLTRPTFLVSVAEECLIDHADAIGTVHFLGGTGAVNQDVRDRVGQLLK